MIEYLTANFQPGSDPGGARSLSISTGWVAGLVGGCWVGGRLLA